MQKSLPVLRYIIAGNITRNFVITSSGKTFLDMPGGSLFYAAGGFGIWENGAGLLARVGEDFPRDWLNQLSQRNLDTRGIKTLQHTCDLRSFKAYTEDYEKLNENPVKHFARLGLHFPKSLLGYTPVVNQDQHNKKSFLKIHKSDIPDDYLDTSSLHICPMDMTTQNLLALTFRQHHVNTIMLDTAGYYMKPHFFQKIPALINDLNVLFTSKEKVLNLFQGKSSDLWEICETLAGFGCEVIVIKCGKEGQLVYDHARRTRWHIPAYPVSIIEPTGAGDAFCGGFMAGYRLSYEPLEAALYGNISASLCLEGCSPFYCWDSLPGLAKARLDSLKNQVERV
jgi:sugar/nucleoside kinase (ribokinase family)